MRQSPLPYGRKATRHTSRNWTPTGWRRGFSRRRRATPEACPRPLPAGETPSPTTTHWVQSNALRGGPVSACHVSAPAQWWREHGPASFQAKRALEVKQCDWPSGRSLFGFTSFRYPSWTSPFLRCLRGFRLMLTDLTTFFLLVASPSHVGVRRDPDASRCQSPSRSPPTKGDSSGLSLY